MIPPGTPTRSRREAHALKLTKFWPGTPCRRGHYEMRYTRNGNCCGCMLEARNGFARTDDEGRQTIALKIFPALREAVERHAAALETAYLMSIPAGVPAHIWESNREK